jgi:heptosyltransferase-2
LEDQQAADRLLSGLPKTWVAIHPGSGSSKKNWPIERWEEVIHNVRRTRDDAAIAIISGEADADAVSHLRLAFGESLHVFENLPLNVLGTALGRCALFLGHDSGISHLAAAAGASSLLLFGPTDPESWAPRGRHVRVIRGAGGSLQGITPSQVMEEVSLLFANHSNLATSPVR